MIEIVRCAEIAACDISVRVAVAVGGIQGSAYWTRELQVGGTGPDEVPAEVLAGEDFFVGTWSDLAVD